MEVGEVIITKDNKYTIKVNKSPKRGSILSSIRSFPGRVYDQASRSWSVRIDDKATKTLQDLGFKIPFTIPIKSHKSRSLFPDGDLMGMLPYQGEGCQAIHDFHGRALVADEMGLGKTVEAAMYLRLNPALRPALIVCPASLKINWSREIKKWCPDDKDVTIVDGTFLELPNKGIVIINYEMLKKYTRIIKKPDKTGHIKKVYKIKKILAAGYRIVIFDEAHYMANKGTQRTEIGIKIAKKTEKCIGLTGTPILSRPIEIFNFVHALRPDIFDSRFRFGERYCNMSHNGRDWDFSGCNKSNMAELHKLLTSTVMIRRLKNDVLKQLPPRRFSVIPLEVENRDEYRRAEAEVLGNLGGTLNKFLVQCEYLKAVAMDGKFNLIVDWINNTLLETGEKLVVMAHHREVIARLMDIYGDKAVRLTGKENDIQKQEAVDAFREDPKVRLFFGSLKAASLGHNLTVASKLAIIEFLWTPGIHDQAADRIHRYGQSKPVNVYYLIADNTIELDLAEMLDNKRKNVSAITDGREAAEDTLLLELYNKYKERRIA